MRLLRAKARSGMSLRENLDEIEEQCYSDPVARVTSAEEGVPDARSPSLVSALDRLALATTTSYSQERSEESAHMTRRGGRQPGEKAYVIAVHTGRVDEADKRAWWYIPAPGAEQTEKIRQLRVGDDRVGNRAIDLFDCGHLSMKRGDIPETTASTCAHVYVMLTGVKACPDGGAPTTECSEKKLLRPATDHPAFEEGAVDEFVVSAPDLGDIVKVQFFLEDPPGQEPPDWSAKRWKLDRVAVTCVQHDQAQRKGKLACCAARYAKGEFAEKHRVSIKGDAMAPVTGNNVQWHFIPNQSKADASMHWLGQLPARKDVLTISREPNEGEDCTMCFGRAFGCAQPAPVDD